MKYAEFLVAFTGVVVGKGTVVFIVVIGATVVFNLVEFINFVLVIFVVVAVAVVGTAIEFIS